MKMKPPHRSSFTSRRLALRRLMSAKSQWLGMRFSRPSISHSQAWNGQRITGPDSGFVHTDAEHNHPRVFYDEPCEPMFRRVPLYRVIDGEARP